MNLDSEVMHAVDELEYMPIDEYREAIAAAYFELPERLDVRYLWTKGPLSLFRVNWWHSDSATGESYIRRSEFVAVERTADGLVLRPPTWRWAA